MQCISPHIQTFRLKPKTKWNSTRSTYPNSRQTIDSKLKIEMFLELCQNQKQNWILLGSLILTQDKQ